jgi:NADH-quinone oxidoreductase subunit C
MSIRIETLASSVETHFGTRLTRIPSSCDELTYEVAAAELLDVAVALRDGANFKFEQLVDLSGIDYLDFGRSEWSTTASTATGFSRGVKEIKAHLSESVPGIVESTGKPRFAIAVHLLSIANNVRLRLRCYCLGDQMPAVDSLTNVWASSNWYEREAFDLYGILFNGHPDLRRLLTDYGFIGHPFRKDFPLIGNVEVRYDPSKQRVVYQPVSIVSRTLVPRVIRDDNRYTAELKDTPAGASR